MARQSYDDATKAAVMAALLAGQGIMEISKQYGVNPSTIRNWRSANNLENAIDQEQRYEIGDLLLAYLRESLNALRLQAQHFGQAAWLANQNAADLAVLHGVQTDKAIRIIEALTAGGEADQGEDRGGAQ